MAKVWEFFENMDEIVYVVNMDTSEMIYMNRKAMEAYGYQSMDEIIGRKCYQVQGEKTSCSRCITSELKEGYFKEVKYYNPVVNKTLRMKSTMVMDEGRRCRIDITIDESQQEHQQGILHRFQNMEALANESIRVALGASTPNQAIDILLAHLGRALRGERTYVFERNKRGNDDNTYEWTAKNITPEKDNLQDLPAEVCAKWYQSLRKDKNIVIKDLEEIREDDPLQYENLKRQGIQTLVVVPLYDDGTIIGFYGIDNPPVDFLDYASNILQIVGHFLVSTLRRRNLIKELVQMSYHDQLTKLGNRYGMNVYVENLSQEKSIGVVYCDITGLKRENDTNGHEAGDRLILRACDALKSVFSDYGLFRIGGDELLALCGGIKEEELQERLADLRTKLSEYTVNMAIGAVWQREGVIDIDKLLKESEQLMYEDKALFYQKSGMDRRRW